MKNTFGNQMTLTLFGESHGPAVGLVVDGITPGLPVSKETIENYLSKRRPAKYGDTSRVEQDRFQITSGVFNDFTTGTPLCISITNSDTISSVYEASRDVPRPSHADYTADVKFNGFQDYRGGGHFSGRLTAPIVALSGILLPALEKKGITISSKVINIGGCNNPALFDEVIENAKNENDSLGGIVETVITGLEAGLGEPWFDSLESVISHAVFSLGGVKGIEFGEGFKLASMTGSEANDPFRIENNKVVTSTNHSGGINGGISNGMPVVFRTAVKPTPSISRQQESVNIRKMQNEILEIKGRHDTAIVRRISPVIDALSAFVICDMLMQRHGVDCLR